MPAKPLRTYVVHPDTSYVSCIDSVFSHTWLCLLAVYHWMEVNFRLRLMGMGKAKNVERLTEDMAIELGAEMLGEFIIFTVAAGTLLLEYNKSVTKEALKEEREKHQMLMLKSKLQVSPAQIKTKQERRKKFRMDVLLCVNYLILSVPLKPMFNKVIFF